MVERKLRVAIVGAQQSRVAKVVSLLNSDEEDTLLFVTTVAAPNSNDMIRVEYLPCVACFDFYDDEQGKQVRYLAKLEYHGVDGRRRGTSLAPFFDENDEQADKDNGDKSVLPFFPGISAVAIGCGIESPEDVGMIRTLVKSLSGGHHTDERKSSRSILVQCVTPNSEYTTMKEETEAYKTLSVEEKEVETRLRTLGPGKMASFAHSLAQTVIDSTLKDGRTNRTASPEASDANNDPDIEGVGGEESNSAAISQDQSILPSSIVISPSKKRYACRRCRTILFGQDQLENPPHVPRLHSFSRVHSSRSSNQCESLFLSDGLDWMGDISAAVEGKFECPKCSMKIGTWKWAGAQCSCGTWVTPAIQVPLSKVDTIFPCNETFPSLL